VAAVEYVEPTTVEGACRLLSDDPLGSKALAGGTAVSLMMSQGLIAPSRLVSLAKIEELTGIEEQNGAIRIGAGTTLTAVAGSPVVQRRLPSLAKAARSVGNIRVRNVATLGGNLAEADYASDPPAALASLGAVCEVRSADGHRSVDGADFVTGFYANALEDGELLTAITIPTLTQRRTAYHRFVTRSSEDRPCVSVAVRADMDGPVVEALDVVVGAVAERPQRLDEAMAAAAGWRLDDDLIENIATAYKTSLDPMDDQRGSEWYRRQIIEVLVRRALGELAEPGGVGSDG
jgi:carbon-monoxide dehydrogenase medium subunit